MRQLLRRAWYLLRQRQVDEDLAEEMDFHRAMTQRAIEDRGVDPAEAAFAARRAFGSAALAGDRSRDVWIPRWLQGIGQDVRLAVRTLFANQIVSVVAVLSLALGIGANTAIFSLVNSLVLRALPVRDPARLVLITDGVPTRLRVWSYAVWHEIHQRRELFDSTAAWSFTRFNLASGGETQLVDGLWASGSFFETLGVPAVLGRTFSEADDRRGGGPDGPVTVISYGYWQRQFGGAADVIGRTLRLDSLPFTIVGVTPPDFFGADVGRTFDVVVPLGDEPLIRGRETYLDSTGTMFLTVIARLRTEQSTDSAIAGLRRVQSEIREATLGDLVKRGRKQALDRYLKTPFALTPAATGYSGLRLRYQRPLLAIMTVVALVLLIACVNIANLLLARATARRHELSVRLALGASRWQLVRQLFTESVVLAGAGAALGLLLAAWSSRVLVRQLSTPMNTVFLDLPIDARMLAFTIGTAAMTALLFGTAPAFRASGVAPMDALNEHGRATAGQARGGLASWLVVAQVALSVILVVAAGLFVRTFASLTMRQLGFQPGPVLIVTMDAQRADVDPAERVPMYEGARDAVRALPNVADAAVSLTTPFSNAFTPPVEISGVPASETQGELFGNLISTGWFSTFGTPLIAGRDLTDRDRKGAPRVAVVNETFARKVFGGRTPLGHTISLYPNSALRLPPMEIVGVAADAVYVSIREPVPPTWYVPIDQFDLAFMPDLSSARLSVRSKTGAPALLTRNITAAIAGVNPQLALTFRPLADQVDAALTQERLIALLAGFFGVLALLLAGLGLYGVTAYAVSRRRREIGIRMALGAAPAGVVRLVMSRLTMLVGLGVMIGAGVSLWASRFVASLLYGLEPRDPATLAGAIVVLAAVGALAAWLPARRASRVDPAIVLRYE
jgi:putative ABC transport system permease protein